MKLPVFPPLWRSDSERPVSFAIAAKRIARVVLSLAAACAVLAAIYVLGIRLDHFVRESPFFVIREIQISGASDKLAAEIRSALGDRMKDGEDNLVLFNLSHAQFWIETLPRVSKARIEKRYPRTLEVDVVERQPVSGASAGGLYWIDRDGFLLAKAEPAELAEAKAPMLTGLRGSRFAPGMKLDQPRLAEALKAIRFLRDSDPELGRKFVEWHINSQDELVGILDQGVEVRFGSGDPISRLPVLASAMRQIDGIEKRSYVDLRFESQVVYR